MLLVLFEFNLFARKNRLVIRVNKELHMIRYHETIAGIRYTDKIPLIIFRKVFVFRILHGNYNSVFIAKDLGSVFPDKEQFSVMFADFGSKDGFIIFIHKKQGTVIHNKETVSVLIGADQVLFIINDKVHIGRGHNNALCRRDLPGRVLFVFCLLCGSSFLFRMLIIGSLCGFSKSAGIEIRFIRREKRDLCF